MRTDDEIIARIKEIEGDDIFGFERGDLLEVLSFEAAKPFLRDDATADKWKAAARDFESAKLRILEYLPFAWDKANNCRGISAMRSLMHMRAWLWLMGEDSFIAERWPNGIDYEMYGKPDLRAISERYGFDWRRHDDNKWRSSESDSGVTADEAAS